MEDFAEIIPLTVPIMSEPEKERVIGVFRQARVNVKIVDFTLASDFVIDLARHAASFPFEHLVDMIEGALGLAILKGLHGLRGWFGDRIRLLLRLPGKRKEVLYRIPPPPADKAALKALKKHYNALPDNHADEYVWGNKGWTAV